MGRRRIPIACAVALAALPASASAAPSARDLQRLADATVRIFFVRPSYDACAVAPRRHGSGLLVRFRGETFVLTAGHVADGTELLSMVLPRRHASEADPPIPVSLVSVVVDRSNDVSVLRILDAGAAREASRRAVAVAPKAPPYGADVWVLGYPLDATQETATVSRGVFAGEGVFPRFGNSVRLARVTGASIRSGSSGGPVLDGGGRLVGLIAGTAVDEGVRAEGQAQASTPDAIGKALAEAVAAHPKAASCPVCARVSQALVLADGYRDARDEAQAAFWDDLASRALGDWTTAPVKDAPALMAVRCGRRGPALSKSWCKELMDDVNVLRARDAWIPPMAVIGACYRTGSPGGLAPKASSAPEPRGTSPALVPEDL